MADQVKWFEALGNCSCGKAATGLLRGPGFESYGPSCLRCAERRIKLAEKDREREKKAFVSLP